MSHLLHRIFTRAALFGFLTIFFLIGGVIGFFKLTHEPRGEVHAMAQYGAVDEVAVAQNSTQETPASDAHQSPSTKTVSAATATTKEHPTANESSSPSTPAQTENTQPASGQTQAPAPAQNSTPEPIVSEGDALASGAVAGEIRFIAYTTGYGWPDNTPKGSAEISNPIIHSKAGGTGTYEDPITLAVGHTLTGGEDILDYSEGTKFYIPNLKKYFIVEDTCGDGNKPQNGPCHTGYQNHPWLDLWVGGNSSNQKETLACEDTITDLHLVIQNPGPNYAVISGDVASSCKNYGDTVLVQ